MFFMQHTHKNKKKPLSYVVYDKVHVIGEKNTILVAYNNNNNGIVSFITIDISISMCTLCIVYCHCDASHARDTFLLSDWNTTYPRI